MRKCKERDDAQRLALLQEYFDSGLTKYCFEQQLLTLAVTQLPMMTY